MKIVVTGTTGRLGAALARAYAGRHEVIAPDRSALDLAAPASMRAALEPVDYDVLINSAALTDVDAAERNAAGAFGVNARGPAALAEITAEKGARMIQISTDYVFDGVAKGLRVETDPVNPQTVYGRSKLEGENAVLAVDGSFLVVRTSWIFGPGRPGFVDTILGRALAEERVEAIEDKDSSPTYSIEFARLLEPLLGDRSRGGVLHLCNAGSCSWRELGQAVLDLAAAAGVPLRARKVEGFPLARMRSFVAARPIHTAMATAKFTAWTGRSPRPWRDALASYIGEQAAAARWRGRGSE